MGILPEWLIKARDVFVAELNRTSQQELDRERAKLSGKPAQKTDTAADAVAAAKAAASEPPAIIKEIVEIKQVANEYDEQCYQRDMQTWRRQADAAMMVDGCAPPAPTRVFGLHMPTLRVSVTGRYVPDNSVPPPTPKPAPAPESDGGEPVVDQLIDMRMDEPERAPDTTSSPVPVHEPTPMPEPARSETQLQPSSVAPKSEPESDMLDIASLFADVPHTPARDTRPQQETAQSQDQQPATEIKPGNMFAQELDREYPCTGPDRSRDR